MRDSRSPFLVFELPLIGETLTKVRYTAYDQTGLLVAKLTKTDVATLYERRYPSPAVGAGAAKQDASLDA